MYAIDQWSLTRETPKSLSSRLQRLSYSGLTLFSAFLVVLLVWLFLGVMAYSSIYNIGTYGTFLSPEFNPYSLFSLVFMGFLFALFSSILAWPFAMATAVVLVQESGRAWAQWAIRFFRALTFIPSLVYGFIFCWSLGPVLQSGFQSTWMSLFAEDSILTSIFSFGVTMFTYPVVVLFSKGQGLTINEYYSSVGTVVVDLADATYSSIVIILALAFLLVPTFTVLLYRVFLNSKNDKYIEAARAIGATEWESLHLAMTQSMRTKFKSIIVFGVAKSFISGILIFIVLNFFFFAGNWHELFWVETLSSYAVKVLFFHNLSWFDYGVLAGILFMIHLLLGYWRQSFILIDDEELLI